MKFFLLKYVFPKLILLFLLVFFAGTSQAQKMPDYHQLLLDNEDIYDIGNYKKLVKKNLQISKKITEKYQNDVFLQAWNFAQKAKNLEAQAKYIEMETALNEAKTLIKDKSATNPNAYAQAIAKIAEVYSIYGNQQKAMQTLDLLNNTGIENPVIKADLSQIRAMIMLQSGEFAKADSIVKSLLDERNKFLEDKNLQKNISRQAKKNYTYQLASLYTLQGQVFTKSGFYERGDSSLQASRMRVYRLVGVRNTRYAKHLIAIGENYDGQEEYAKASDYYNKALRASEFYAEAFKENSKTYYLLQEGITRNSILRKRLFITQMANMFELKRIAKKHFGEQSAYFARAKIIEIEKDIAKKNFNQATTDLLKFLADENTLPKDHEIRAKAQEMLASVYTKNDTEIKEMDEAHKNFIKTQNLRLIPNSFEDKVAKIKLAHYNSEFGEDFEQAKTVFENTPYAIIQKTLSPTQKDFVPLSNYYAQYYETNDRFQDALNVLETSTALLEKKYGADNYRLIAQLNKLASIHTKLGNYKIAEQIINRSIVIIKAKYSETSPEYAESLSNMARLHAVIGNYTEAEIFIRSANLKYQTLEKNKEEGINFTAIKAESIEDLAGLYVRIGDYANTEKLLLENIAIKEKKYGKNSRKLISPLYQLGNLYLIKGDYLAAEVGIQRLENIAEKSYGKKSIAYADGKELFARLHSSFGDYVKAEKEAKEALSIQETILGRNHIKNAYTMSNLGEVMFISNPQKNRKQVENHFVEAKRLVENTFDKRHPQYAESLKNLATIYIENKRYKEAEALLEEANNIWITKLGEKNINTARVFTLKGDAATRQGSFSAADAHYTKASELFKGIFDENHESYIKTLSKLGRVQFSVKNYERATTTLELTTKAYLNYIQKYFPALSEQGKAKYWSSVADDFEFYKTLAYKQLATRPDLMGNVYNHTLATKAILLNSSIKIKQRILSSGNNELIKAYQNWINKKENLSTALSLSPADRLNNGLNISSLEKDIEILEKELSLKSEFFAEKLDNKIYTWKDVQMQLKPNEAALEIVRFRLFDKTFSDSTIYVAMKVTTQILPTGSPEVVVMNDGNEMEKERLAYYRNAVKFKLKDRFSYEALWKPIEKLLGDKKIAYLSADGVYNQINLETVLLPNNEGYVIDKYNLIAVGNTKDIITKKLEKKVVNNEKLAVLFGNPSFYKNKELAKKIQPLAGTGKEVSNLKTTLEESGWRVTNFTELVAEENKVKEISSPKIFHIATHGFFAPDEKATSGDLGEGASAQNPLFRSGLLLVGAGDIFSNEENTSFNSQDGVLTAYEAMNLNFDNTEIVILSACETGVGEVQVGEGVFGLQRAFLVAGADQVVMSLFKVDDDVTQLFMTEFYKNFLKSSDKRQAFHEAKLTIKKTYPAPIFWGAFVIFGLEK